MTETNFDADPSIISRIPAGLTQGAHPSTTVQGDSTTRRRPPMSQEQRQKLSLAQKAYVTTDPRWAEHRQKLADAQIAKRTTLFPNELAMVLAMRSKGRTLHAPDPRQLRRSQADFPLIGLSEFGRPPLYVRSRDIVAATEQNRASRILNVAIELGMCRCERNGRASCAVAAWNKRFLASPGLGNA